MEIKMDRNVREDKERDGERRKKERVYTVSEALLLN